MISLFQTTYICNVKSFCVHQGYELRRYEASQWVATRNIITNYDSREKSQMFFKLFHYISGNNTASKCIVKRLK